VNDSLHVLVLMGGDSPEREISLKSGAAVAGALAEAGHRAEAVDVPRVAAVVDLPALREADVVFPALHGGQGEDGHLQAVLDVLGVRYALSGPLASALAMNKGATKRIMRAAGIPTPQWLQVTWNHRSAEAATGGTDRLTVERVLERAVAELGFPLVVKLNDGGSSVGVEIVMSPSGFPDAFARVAATGVADQVDVLLEKFIPGRELTAAILLGRRLPLLEIKPSEGFYDYDNKYTAGASDYLVPAPVHSPLYEQISADALRLYELVGCRGVARVDIRLDGESYNCLEINTIPGLTATSLVPMAAEAVGIGVPELVEDLCRQAMGTL